MGVFDKFNDSPNQIKLEGQEISIKFQRTSNNTARISWTIPAPANGCNAANQAYDGIVITISSKPANYISTSPKDGIYYNSDSTADSDLHIGDKLDGALIIGAIYHDKTTTFIDITDVFEKTAYFVSGYAVDNVGRYHREGVHAYSLPTGEKEFINEDTPAYHDIGLDSEGQILPSNLTGLLANTNYQFTIKLDCTEYDISIHGSNALTYNNLIQEINKQFALMMLPYISPLPPNSNGYYVDIDNSNVYKWSGYLNNLQNSIFLNFDPSVPLTGTYWYDTDINVLYQYQSSWIETQVISSPTDPLTPSCNQLWMSDSDVWEWEGDHWCKLCLYTSTRNPLLAPIMDCESYWLDETNNKFNSWDNEQKKWKERLVIVYDSDPNLLNTGDYWFNELDNKMYQYVGGSWNKLSNIRYSERAPNGELPPPDTLASHYWYIPSEGVLYQRNLMNTEWDERTFVSYPKNPLTRKSCDLWLNSSTNILYVWDELNSEWNLIENFTISVIDPAAPATLPECAVWYNPETKELKRLNTPLCSTMSYIHYPTDPTAIADGAVWFDGINFFELIDGIWIELQVIKQSSDPFNISDGIIWFDTTNELLYLRNLGAWSQLTYSVDPLVPQVNTLWYDSVNDKLMEWNGTTWVVALPFAAVEFVSRTCAKTKDTLHFFTKRKGCGIDFEIIVRNNTLFTSLNIPVIYYDAVNGNSSLVSGPMYSQLGVGDDGSPDERRQLHADIRTMLGSMNITVELSKEAIDLAINNALAMFRKYSSISYTRAMFFLDLKPNQQTYVLTNKCVGFNKIVKVTSIHRMRAGAFKTAYAMNDNFAFAALQQLYTLGTFDILTYHLTSSYLEELEVLFASRIMHHWNEKRRELKIYQSTSSERVLIDAVIERTEQDLITDRESKMWIQAYTLADCKHMLSQSRGKFQTLPGPNGSTTLNAMELASQAVEEKNNLMQEIVDMAYQNPEEIGMRSHFIIG